MAKNKNPYLPEPKVKPERVNMQGMVPVELHERVEKELETRGMKWAEFMEFVAQRFLDACEDERKKRA